jgi:hypothetical protein
MEYIGWLYLATRLDSIYGCFWFFLICGCISMLMIGFSRIDYCDYSASEIKKFWEQKSTFLKTSIFLILFGLLGISLVPTKKDAMFIAAGVGVIEGAKAMQGSEIAKKSVLIIEKWLDDELKDTSKKETK